MYDYAQKQGGVSINKLDRVKIGTSLTEQIMKSVREDILNKIYAPGERIKELDLTSKFGVSRTPVREALRQLVVDGLIDYTPNVGVVVVGVTDQDAKDIVEVLAAIEELAVVFAFEKCDSIDLDELREYYDLMEFYKRKEDFESVLALDEKFHNKLCEMTENRYLQKILKGFYTLLTSYRKCSVRMGERLNEVLEEHRAIIDAIDEGNLEEMVERTQLHRRSLIV